MVIVTLANIYGSELPALVDLYLMDEILDLPRTKDWLGKEAMDRAKKSYFEVAQANSGAELPPRLKNKPAAHALEEYEGVYSSPLFAGDVTISVESDVDENGLRTSGLHFLFNTFASKVEHYHFETFLYEWDYWAAQQKELMSFVTGENGKVDALQLNYLDKIISFKKQARVKQHNNEQGAFGWDQSQFGV